MKKVQGVVKGRRSIKNRIVIMVSFLLVMTCLSIGISSYFIAKKQLETQGKLMLENTVNMILLLIDAKNQEVKRGSISLEEAQEEVKTYILGKAEVTGKEIEVAYNQNGDKKKIKEIKRPLNKSIYLGEHGYPIIYSQDGFEVAHPSLEGANVWNLKEKGDENGIYVVREQIEAAKQEGGGYVTYAWTYPNSEEIAEKITFQKVDPNWGWVVIAGTYMSDFNKGANQILSNLGLVIFISVAVGLVIALVVVNRIVKPILAMVHMADELSQGDFTEKAEVVKSKDEIGLLAHSLSNVRVNVREMLTSINESSGRLYTASEELTASAEQSAQASNQVAIAVGEVALSTERQLTLASEADQMTKEISSSIVGVLEHTKDVTSAAQMTKDTANTGVAVIEKVIVQMNTISEKSAQTSQVIAELEEKSKQIGNIVDVISNISEQTNLLALNAAIEAARAGESGKGFSVVAEEVRKLAEQSKISAAQITELVKDVQIRTASAVVIVNDGRREATEGTKIVKDAGSNFEAIQTKIEDMSLKIQEIYAGVKQISLEAENVVGAVNHINEASRKNSEETENISATTEEQSATTEEIAAASESLATMAEELQEAIKQFVI